MSAPREHLAVRFLKGLGYLLNALGLYPTGHPHRKRAVREASEAARGLVDGGEPALFSFPEGRVIFGREPLAGLEGWPWAGKLAAGGVGRLELSPGLEPGEMEALAAGLAARLGLARAEGDEGGPRAGGGDAAATAGEAAARHPHVAYGPLGVREAEVDEPETGPAVPAQPLELGEEAEAIQWLHEESVRNDRVPAAESGAVVSALLVAVRSARELVAPLLEIQAIDQYTTTHCVNVSILSMSLAEYLGLGEADVMAIGEAALLHDIGRTRIPARILTKPGKLTPQERAVVEFHATEGARMLLRNDDRGVLAAVVAAEHHMHWDGKGGYPKAPPGHRPHRFSRLVHVCDVYDALRTRRPFRPPFSGPAALRFLRRRAASEFDPEMVEAFLSMMERWDPKTVMRADQGPEEEDPADLERRVESAEAGFDADTERELYPAHPVPEAASANGAPEPAESGPVEASAADAPAASAADAPAASAADIPPAAR